jgi:fimbrial chaperone protein
MLKRSHRLSACLWFAGLLLACTHASGSGLQVSPTLLTLQATQNADGLWLSNTSDSTLHAQVRVYLWTQEGGKDKLVPSRGLVISPPMLALQAQQRQLVRVIRIGGAPSASTGEVAYRIILDELPVDRGAHDNGLQFVLRYSLPVFVEPTGAAPSPPQLHWSLQRDNGKAVLEVSNSGGKYAQIVDLNYIDATKHRTEVAQGLLGYVLPGATMRWTLKPPAALFSTSGKFEATINGEKATQNLPLADHAR